jgi:hypothetical protein
LPSVDETKSRIAHDILPRIKSYMAEARQNAVRELGPLEQKRQYMHAKHLSERLTMDAGQKARGEAENRQRAERLRKGLAGVWDRLRGEYSKRRKQNEMEAFMALQRDREQRHAMIQAQLNERQQLQVQIRKVRTRHAEKLHDLHKDAANYRLMQRGEVPKLQREFEQARPAPPQHTSAQERLQRLRDGLPPNPGQRDREPER